MAPHCIDSTDVVTELSPTATKRVAFYTLGCRANQLESATLAASFSQDGWQVVPFEDPAHVVVVNTCTVTERADQEARRIVRRVRLTNPEARVVMTGCYAQVAPDVVKHLDGVHWVVGNQFKEDLAQIVAATPNPSQPLVQVGDIDKSRIMAGATAADIGRTRGSLKIQDGCDYKCTYCIIWRARGPSRSLPMADVIAHLSQMVAPHSANSGFKEIQLTGINIGQYDDQGHDLADLLEALVAVPGDFRLRLTSLDPLEVTDRLIETIARHNTHTGGKICPHVHLSAQSADDTVLKAMARRHHVADMMRICLQLQARVPGVCIGSDIIAGFPGETDAQHQHTVDVLQSVPMHYLHVFSYSPRSETPAAAMAQQVPQRVIKQRADQLKALSDERWLIFRQGFIGETLTAIAESDGTEGMAANFIKLQWGNAALSEPKALAQEAPQPIQNDWVNCRVTVATNEGTYGTVESVQPVR
jgi:threonylcarbamoyladenosine tRNA methylthiotransferase MtaB